MDDFPVFNYLTVLYLRPPLESSQKSKQIVHTLKLKCQISGQADLFAFKDLT